MTCDQQASLDLNRSGKPGGQGQYGKVRKRRYANIMIVYRCTDVYNLREIIEEDRGGSGHTSFYWFDLTENNLLIVSSRKAKIELTPKIKIPSWAEAKAREIACVKWDMCCKTSG